MSMCECFEFGSILGMCGGLTNIILYWLIFPQTPLQNDSGKENKRQTECCYYTGGVEVRERGPEPVQGLVSQAAAGLLWGLHSLQLWLYLLSLPKPGRGVSKLSFGPKELCANISDGAGDNMAPSLSWERDVMNEEWALNWSFHGTV